MNENVRNENAYPSENENNFDKTVIEKSENSTMQNAPKIFHIIDGNTLMKKKYEPLKFAVEKILPHGLFIIAGSGKIGKSFFSLDLCVSIATGNKLWDYSCEYGDVLYLALEDNYRRLQDRLNKIKARNIDISRLKLTTSSFGISSGLIEQANNHIAKFPDTKLVVIDTLERVRDTIFDKNIYACDYRDMTALRKITDKHELTLLLVHHTRKLRDDDPLNTLSGSMGLVGSVDGVYVLEKLIRSGDDAKLTISNRDTEDFCFALKFDRENCKWMFMGNYEEQPAGKGINEKDEWLIMLIDELVQDEWKGSATELCDALKEIDPDCDVAPRTITKRLKNSIGLLEKNGITLTIDRNRDSRVIIINRINDNVLPEENQAAQEPEQDCDV